MSEELQPDKKRVREADIKLQLKTVFENTLPALFGTMAAELRKLRDLIPPDDRGFGQNAVLDQDIKLLERLDIEGLKSKVLRELTESSDLLAVSLLAIIAVRAHLNIARMERELKEADRAKRGLSGGGKELVDLIRGEQVNTESVLSGFLDRSDTFGRRYAVNDLWEFVRENERIAADAKRGGVKLRRMREEAEILGRILRKEFREGDEEQLQAIIDQRMADGLSLIELDVLGALQEKPGMRDQLRANVKALLGLYQIRELADRIFIGEAKTVKE